MCATIANDNRTTIQPIVFETNKTGDTKRKKRYSGNPSSLSHTAPAELTDNELNKQKNKLLATEKIESGAKRVSHGMDADVEVKEPEKMLLLIRKSQIVRLHKKMIVRRVMIK